jgi:hypothetical protein
MRKAATLLCALGALNLFAALPARAELLAALNYETKAGVTPRREGIAIMDIDPASPRFNQILKDAPLPPDVVAHHIYFNRDRSKAYVTMLGRSAIAVFDIERFPEKPEIVAVPDCKMGEDMVFTADRKRWFLTCLGSSNVIMGDAETNRTLAVIAAPEPKPGEAPRPFIRNPHGATLNDALDLLIVTSTTDPELKTFGETITAIQASSGQLLGTWKVSDKPSPSGAGPVETAFVPNRNPHTAFITNMHGGGLWSAVWKTDAKAFELKPAFDFSAIGQGMPLEMEFNAAGDRLYVTTAKPGALNIFDISDIAAPKLLASIPAAEGAHHFVFSPDRRHAFVQNSLLNLPGLSDGSVTVVDLITNQPVGRIDALSKAGLNPNCIILLPGQGSNED